MRATGHHGPAQTLRHLMAVALSLTLAYPTFGQADGELKIRATQGEGAFNDMKSHTGRGLSVEVQDENGRPVSGATVSFTAPALGAGGTFSNGQRIVSVTTDALGVAASGEFRPNAIEGRFNISVQARQGNKTGSAVFGQSNTLAGAAAKGSKKKWIIIGLIAAGGAGAGLAFRGGGSSAQNTPAVLSVGTITVGGPR